MYNLTVMYVPNGGIRALHGPLMASSISHRVQYRNIFIVFLSQPVVFLTTLWPKAFGKQVVILFFVSVFFSH